MQQECQTWDNKNFLGSPPKKSETERIEEKQERRRIDYVICLILSEISSFSRQCPMKSDIPFHDLCRVIHGRW